MLSNCIPEMTRTINFPHKNLQNHLSCETPTNPHYNLLLISHNLSFFNFLEIEIDGPNIYLVAFLIPKINDLQINVRWIFINEKTKGKLRHYLVHDLMSHFLKKKEKINKHKELCSNNFFGIRTADLVKIFL